MDTSIIEMLERERAAHLERTALAGLIRDMRQLAVDEERYGWLLEALSIIHSALGAAAPAEIVALGERLRADRAALGGGALPEGSAAWGHAQLLAEQLRLEIESDEAMRWGAWFALQGHALSDPETVSALRRSVSAKALSYIGALEPGAAARAAAAASGSTAQAQRIIATVTDIFSAIEGLLSALEAGESVGIDKLVRAINPAAGVHAIPSDLAEIRAGLRAGLMSWYEMPYYEWRYGLRGRRFTRSDTAWIVTLAEHEQSFVDAQLGWLGRVLAARGMPRWLLERHLEGLVGELSAARPEKRAQYERLARTAALLRAEREQVMTAATFEEARVAFDRAVGSEWQLRLPNIGMLIASAIADERAGVANARESLLPWLSDSERFPPEWIAAVNAVASLVDSAARP